MPRTALEKDREVTRQLQNHCNNNDGDAGAPPSVTEPNARAPPFSLEVSAMEEEGREGGKEKEKKERKQEGQKRKRKGEGRPSNDLKVLTTSTTQETISALQRVKC